MIKLFLILTLFLSVSVPLTYSQEKKSSNIDEIVDIDDFEQIKFDRLKRIRKEITQVESDIYRIKKKSLNEDDMVNKLKLESEMEKLKEEYNDKRVLFIETLTGLSILSKSDNQEKEKKSLSEDLASILEPALNGVKTLSERPRQIQSLEDKVKLLKFELENIALAKSKIEQFKSNKDYKEFSRVLKKSQKKLDLLENDYKIQLEDAQFKLIKLEQNTGSFVGAFSQVIFDFLKTKGKNLFLAISVFCLIIWLLSLAKNKVINFFVQRIIKIYGLGEHGAWYVRPIKVMYSVLGFLLALFVAIVILYILNDWVLVTFILIIISALVWSSKQHLSLFVEQSKIVLNLGAIRENEVVIYNGIPWKIKSLGYYCRLENPLLTGGSLRISSKELLPYHSRPVQQHEPWFPTKTGDWITLSDGTFGKVTFQSPEQIVIKLIGGASKFLKIDKFLEDKPINLSNGFGVEQIVGVDYGLQKTVTTEIINEIKEFIGNDLRESLKGEFDLVEDFSVEFKSAGASSLDIRLFLVCKGELAAKFAMIERKLQSSFVDVCNRNNYSIPFNQLTVHMAKPNE